MIFDEYEQIGTGAHSSRLGFGPEILVFHWTGGWRDAVRVAQIDYQRKRNRVSAHFSIGRLGEIVQSVDTARAAWHVSSKLRFMDRKKRANQRSIGVEVCNRGFLRGDDWDRISKRQILTARHQNPRARKREWQRYTTAQVESIEDLTHAVCKAHPTIRYVCGHCDWYENKPGAKLDPGPAFPWDTVTWPAQVWPVTFGHESGEWAHRLTEAA